MRTTVSFVMATTVAFVVGWFSCLLAAVAASHGVDPRKHKKLIDTYGPDIPLQKEWLDDKTYEIRLVGHVDSNGTDRGGDSR